MTANMKRLVLDAGYSEVNWVEDEIKGYRLRYAIPNTKVDVSMGEDGRVRITLTGPRKHEFERFTTKFLGGDEVLAKSIVEESTEDM